VVRSAATPSTAGAVASGARVKPGEPGEAFHREALDAVDVPRPSTCRALSWPARTEGKGCFGIGNKHYRS